MLTLSDETIVRCVLEDLRLSLGITAPPAFTWVHRWEKAIPQYQVGHLGRLERIEARLTEHPGLLLSGNSFRGVSLNDCIQQAKNVATRAARYLEDLEA